MTSYIRIILMLNKFLMFIVKQVQKIVCKII